jgi:hypothetical protein
MPLPGDEIEVIIKYRGQEFRPVAGTLREVNIESPVREITGPDDIYHRFEHTGFKTLTLTVDERGRK